MMETPTPNSGPIEPWNSTVLGMLATFGGLIFGSRSCQPELVALLLVKSHSTIMACDPC